MEAIRIQQPQAGEMAGLAQLLGGCSKQQHAGNAAGKLLDQFVFGAGFVFIPDQVVGFIHHQHVPVTGLQALAGKGVVEQELQRHQGQLLLLEGIVLGALASLDVEQRKAQVEASLHLDKPLVLQVLGDHDQHALDPAGLQLAMDNQAGLDGLAQAHFVCEQYPGCYAVGHIAGNVELMFNRLCAHAGKAQQGGALDAAVVTQTFVSQAEPGQGIDLAGKQTVAGEAKLYEVVEHGFGKFCRLVVFLQPAVDQ